jgi:hypothetical protein
MDWRSILGGFLELAFLAGAALYAGLVLMTYLTDSAPVRPTVDRRDPARSAASLAVWLGVKVLALAVRAASPVFAMLSEASAEVGEWFLDRRHHETH